MPGFDQIRLSENVSVDIGSSQQELNLIFFSRTLSFVFLIAFFSVFFFQFIRTRLYLADRQR